MWTHAVWIGERLCRIEEGFNFCSSSNKPFLIYSFILDPISKIILSMRKMSRSLFISVVSSKVLPVCMCIFHFSLLGNLAPCGTLNNSRTAEWRNSNAKRKCISISVFLLLMDSGKSSSSVWCNVFSLLFRVMEKLSYTYGCQCKYNHCYCYCIKENTDKKKLMRG